MAKIKLGALAQDVRGSLAGSTFARNSAGSYVRQKVSPVQPQSALQIAQRGIFSVASQAWRNLDGGERALWNGWAAGHPIVDVFGDALILSGVAACTKINAMRLTHGLAIATTPPADPIAPPVVPTAVVANPLGIVALTYPTGGITTGFTAEVWTPGEVGPGVSFIESGMRLGGFFRPGTDVAPEVDCAARNVRLSSALANRFPVRLYTMTADCLPISSLFFDLVVEAGA